MPNNSGSSEFAIMDSMTYVKISYTVRIADGPLLKGGSTPEIMDFVTGYLQVVPGLEKRLVGRKIGDSLSFTIGPEEAFGQRHDELLIEKERSQFHFPGGMEPFPGMEIPVVTSSEQAPDTAMVREVRENTILIDLNHPLAGMSLQYDLQVVEARPATEKDVCGEWDKVESDQQCCSSVQEIVLPGADD